MIAKVAVLIGLITATSGNTAANKPWHWNSPKPFVEPKGLTPVGPRIVGGIEATPHSWPHQVALYIQGIIFCSGFLISNEWVLTAAHCMDGATFVNVLMGAHNISAEEPTQVTMTSYNYFIYENYNSARLTHDLALIKLPSPVEFNANIQAVKLPSSDISVGTMVTATGWGRTSSSSRMSSVLRQVDVTITPNDDCNAYYGNIGDGHVCIDGAGGKGTCNYDSGGPLNYNGMTYGIASFTPHAGCEKGYPDAFTRVYYYLDWIETKTGVTP